MADLDHKTLRNLAQLARIEFPEEESEKLLTDLREILGYVATLDELDTEETPDCGYVLQEHVNVMRDDEIGETLDRQEFLDNSPAHIGGMLRVPPILKQEAS